MEQDLKGSDSMSESGASTDRGSRFGESREDLEHVAAAVGLNTAAELFQERVRVDRRRLELMILGTDDTLEPAATFFQRINTNLNLEVEVSMHITMIKMKARFIWWTQLEYRSYLISVVDFARIKGTYVDVVPKTNCKCLVKE